MANEKEKEVAVETAVEAAPAAEAVAAVETAAAEEAPVKGGREGKRGRGNKDRKDFQFAKDPAENEFDEVVLSINRCTKVVKGGKNISFGALMVIGDKKGKVGYGYGKANEVPDAIRKAQTAAKKNMITVTRYNELTIPHMVEAKFAGSKILLRPAAPGTGLIAGGAMRAVLELAGIVDVLGKSLGSANPGNVVKATFKALEQMRSKKQVFEKRGISVAE